jgi:hypothetical protein
MKIGPLGDEFFRADERMDGWVDSQMGGWADGRMDGET